MKKTILIILLNIVLSGCAANIARFDWNTNERQQKPITPLFSGVVTDTVAFGESLASPLTGWFKDDGKPWMIFCAPFFVIDIPLSFVADVYFIPADIRLMKEYKDRVKSNAPDVMKGTEAPEASREIHISYVELTASDYHR